MTITITEFRKHYYHYLDVAQEENVYITKYGKVLVVLSKPRNKNRVGIAKEEMKDIDISLEDIDSISIDEFNNSQN